MDFTDTRSAEQAWQRIQALTAGQKWRSTSSAAITIQHSELFDNLEELAKRACELSTSVPGEEAAAYQSSRIEYKIVPLYQRKNVRESAGTKMQIIFENGSPQEISNVVTSIMNETTPIVFNFPSEKEKILFAEVIKDGLDHTMHPLLDAWCDQLHLKYDELPRGGIKIYGPKTSQGALMFSIAEFVMQFENNYILIPLSTPVARLFGKNLAGATKLENLQYKWQMWCSIKFLRNKNSIEPYLNRSVTNVPKELNDDIENLIKELTNQSMQDSRPKCVFCNSVESGQCKTFRICGHFFCSCITQQLEYFTQLPIQCPKCKCNIS